MPEWLTRPAISCASSADAQDRWRRLGGEPLRPALGDLVGEDVLEQQEQILDRADRLVARARPPRFELQPAQPNHAHLDLVAQILQLGCLALLTSRRSLRLGPAWHPAAPPSREQLEPVGVALDRGVEQLLQVIRAPSRLIIELLLQVGSGDLAGVGLLATRRLHDGLLHALVHRPKGRACTGPAACLAPWQETAPLLADTEGSVHTLLGFVGKPVASAWADRPRYR
eukprot:scaffold393_cov104-Isochrysis_galbana.AAC.5